MNKTLHISRTEHPRASRMVTNMMLMQTLNHCIQSQRPETVRTQRICFQNFCFIHFHLFGLFRQEDNSLIFPRNRETNISNETKNKALSPNKCDVNPSTFTICSFTEDSLIYMKSLGIF